MSEAAALRRPERRHLAPPTTDEAASARIAGISASLLMALFFLSLMLPIEPRIGPIRMTPYNALQIILFIPLLIRFRNDPSNRIVPLDFFMAFYVFWIAVVIYHHHGTNRAVYIVNQTVTIFGGYLIGRVMIRNAGDYRRFFTYFFWALLIFLPFAIYRVPDQAHACQRDLLARSFRCIRAPGSRRGSGSSACRASPSIRSSSGSTARSGWRTSSTSTATTWRSG